MKTLPIALVQLALFGLILLFDTSAFVQKNNTWKGGTPGWENNWNCPSNWSNDAVPNAFSDVVIPDVSNTRALPVIHSGTVEVNALLLQSGAWLTIAAPAQLIVYERVDGVHEFNMRGEGLLLLQKKEDAVPSETAADGN